MSGENRCPARRHPSSLPICHCFRLGTPQMWQQKTRLHPLKKPKVNWTCSAWWQGKLVYTLSLQRPKLLLVIFHTRVFSSKEKISRISEILISRYVHCVEPERKSIECVLEIGSCLEVSFIILTKGSTFQSVSFNCPFWGWVLGLNIRPLLSTWFLPNILPSNHTWRFSYWSC